MGKINILDKSVYNRLSAGEVVENPASVVKELVENSIDAGALHITVEILGGGIKSISIIDDGCGIEKDDLERTILSHATSKISEADDLYTIATLGFRGEALASIAAVSNIEIKSKFITEDTANFLKASGGEITEIGVCGLAKGTSITVSSLFFNTPARFKFLKTPKGEESAVTRLMQELILSNPDVSFKYIADNETVYFTNGSGMENALYTVFGNDIYDNLIPIKVSEKGYLIKGVIGRPATEAIIGNKNKQVFIVNGRVFSDNSLSGVIQNAYGDSLMKRTFPIVVIDINVPFDDVDVNVHPRKKEVRFAEQKLIFGMIYRGIKESVESDEKEREEELQRSLNMPKEQKREIYDELKRAVATKELEESNLKEESESLKQLRALMEKYSVDIEEPDENQKYAHRPWPCVEDDVPEDPSMAYMDDLPPHRIAQIMSEPFRLEIDFSDSKFIPQYKDENEAKQEEETLAGIIPNIKTRAMFEKPSPEYYPDYRIIGQLFDTYLIIETEESVYFIDQHAAHERVLYNQLIEGSESRLPIQDLLVPYSVIMQDEELDLFTRHLNNLRKLGFTIIVKGNSVEINSVPCVIADMEVNQFVYSVIQNSGNISRLKDLTEIKSRFAEMACHSAIKGGEKLNTSQIKYFMNYLFANDMPIQCPHGRPTYIKYDKTEVEKWFKRKV